MDPQKFFDAHIHSEGRSVEDLITMSKHRIKAAVTCAFYPIEPLYQETLIDLFRKLSEFETHRGVKAGMEIYHAIGIHPRCIPPAVDKVLDFMDSDDKAVAFGEIGLETASDREVEVFVQQLKLAKRVDKRCIIHTPKANKKQVTEKIMGILDEVEFPPERAVIDHASKSTVEMLIQKGYTAGLTVEEGKLSEQDVAWIVDLCGEDNLLLNSDTGFGSSIMVSVANAARLLEDKFGNEITEKVAWSNAVKFFGL